MKTVALLFFAIALGYSAPITEPTEHKYEHRLLKDIMDDVTELLKEIHHKGFINNVCLIFQPEEFCIAEKILSDINSTQNGIPEKIRKINRVLKQYNMFNPTNCTVTKNEDEEQLRVLLQDLGCCAQDKYSHWNHKRANKTLINNNLAVHLNG
uniref:Uncharacterized protein n=1 Tax=Esox lucius TaxID=8010 RepID=A0A3P8ZA48_ESOLU